MIINEFENLTTCRIFSEDNELLTKILEVNNNIKNKTEAFHLILSYYLKNNSEYIDTSSYMNIISYTAIPNTILTDNDIQLFILNYRNTHNKDYSALLKNVYISRIKIKGYVIFEKKFLKNDDFKINIECLSKKAYLNILYKLLFISYENFDFKIYFTNSKKFILYTEFLNSKNKVYCNDFLIFDSSDNLFDFLDSYIQECENKLDILLLIQSNILEKIDKVFIEIE